jgi:hypothetical protein
MAPGSTKLVTLWWSATGNIILTLKLDGANGASPQGRTERTRTSRPRSANGPGWRSSLADQFSPDGVASRRLATL